MKSLACSLLFVFALPFAEAIADDYPLTEDSKPHEGVPKGEVLKFTLSGSRVFPGTTRSVTVYVPRQYDPAKPACVWVNQDGVQNNAPVVFDNLIARGEMPVTIYIAASPGVVKAEGGSSALDRFNRSFEYDGLGDAFARFVLDELLPFVEAQKTADGRPIRLSSKGSDRCIGGSSSGAICAFNAAWERPDAFQRVFSTIGTYVSLRGADRIPGLVRKFEPRPLRVFLQDGDRDQNIYGGDWWMANQMMERALTFAGYEVNHAWGTGGHDGKQAAAIFPDAVRWIWKDWPKAPAAGQGSPQLKEFLLAGEGWTQVFEEKDGRLGALATGLKGDLFFRDLAVGKIKRIAADGVASDFADDPKGRGNLARTPDGRLLSCAPDEQAIRAFSAGKPGEIVAKGEAFTNVIARHDGTMFAAAPRVAPTGSLLFAQTPGGNAQRNEVPYATAGAFALSPDHTLLYASDPTSHWVYSYQVPGDGRLLHEQRYYHLHQADDVDGSAAKAMAVDAAGRLYVATTMGIQVCDQAGRVNCILNVPVADIASLTIGGALGDTLFAANSTRIFKRKLNTRGVQAWEPPVKPAPPRL